MTAEEGTWLLRKRRSENEVLPISGRDRRAVQIDDTTVHRLSHRRHWPFSQYNGSAFLVILVATTVACTTLLTRISGGLTWDEQTQAVTTKLSSTRQNQRASLESSSSSSPVELRTTMLRMYSSSQQQPNSREMIDERMNQWEEWKRSEVDDHAWETMLWNGILRSALHEARFQEHLDDLTQFHVLNSDTVKNLEDKAKQAGSKAKQQVGSKAKHVGKNVASSVSEIEKDAQNATQQVGKNVASSVSEIEKDAHGLWIRLKNEEQSLGGKERAWWAETSNETQELEEKATGKADGLWSSFKTKEHGVQGKGTELWNHTSEEEKVWFTNILRNAHKFGGHLQAWWAVAFNKTKDEDHVLERDFAIALNKTMDEEHALQQSFSKWWKESRDKEKKWWNETVVAVNHFEEAAEEKSKLWWQITRAATSNGWNEASHIGMDAWNFTVTEERMIWNATQKFFRAHATYEEELAMPLLYLNSTQSYGLLMNQYGWFDSSADFFALQSGWDVQMNQAYCAVASVAATLNSLKGNAAVELPVDPIFDPYYYATQFALMDSCANNNVVRTNKTFDGVFQPPGGLNMLQAKGLLECHLPSSHYSVVAYHLDPAEISISEMKEILLGAINDPFARVVINYDRQTLDQHGGGHFSPLAAYDHEGDRFLVMDVAKYKYPPAWVPAARLYETMATIDSCGDWDFPQALDKIHLNNISFTAHAYASIKKKLGCQPKNRGFLIVRPASSSAIPTGKV